MRVVNLNWDMLLEKHVTSRAFRAVASIYSLTARKKFERLSARRIQASYACMSMAVSIIKTTSRTLSSSVFWKPFTLTRLKHLSPGGRLLQLHNSYCGYVSECVRLGRH